MKQVDEITQICWKCKDFTLHRVLECNTTAGPVLIKICNRHNPDRSARLFTVNFQRTTDEIPNICKEK